MGFLFTLTLVFVVLKLTGQIDWSWLAVLTPLILEALIGFFAVFVFDWMGRK